MSITTKVDKTSSTKGTVLTYTITYKNEGNEKAVNVKISDKIPLGTSYYPDSASGGSVLNGEYLVWNLPAVEAEASGTLSFKVTVQ